MPTHFYIAEAAAGKTAYVLSLARETVRAGHFTPRVVVPTRLQARAFRHRLAQTGGALGVRVLTFDGLIAECLDAATAVYTELSEPVRYRLIRVVVDALPLRHYASLTDRPGFIRILERLIEELKAGMIAPEDFSCAVTGPGDEPRLWELARIYTRYQERLQAQGWADHVGLGWLAVEVLDAHPDLGRDWPLLAVDGFDDFTPVQLALLQRLASRVANMVVTLTGRTVGDERSFAFRRFDRTRTRLEQALGVVAAPLPSPRPAPTSALSHLREHLFRRDAEQTEATGAIEFMEALNRNAEVRAALRWLKARLVEEGMRPGEVVLLARSLNPYRPFILQTAAEFGLPVRLVDGLPLRANPAVAALLDLLRLMLPRGNGTSEPTLPNRLVVDAWRAPYFDWSALPDENASEPIGIGPGDADGLGAVARWGRVIEGLSQWEDAFNALAAVPEGVPDGADDRGRPANLPVGDTAQALHDTFRRFVRRATPLQDKHTFREFVGWLETLIGADPSLESEPFPRPEEPTSLRVVARAHDGAEAVAERDVAALQALKDVLRGLVWAEEVLHTPSVDFVTFFQELVGVVEAASYRLPIHPEREEILVADVVQARGLSFRAVAVLGLAEGEFPASVSEDPFLPDADREHLRKTHGLPLDSSTESAEAGYFYETVSRAGERLLLTRPVLADNGASWPPSPFWEEVRRQVRVTPQRLPGEGVSVLEQAASWAELMANLAARPSQHDLWAWMRAQAPARVAAVEVAARLLGQRRRDVRSPRPFDGDLTTAGDTFMQRFDSTHVWSASRLETYRACPFHFFVDHILHLEPREEPQEGLDARQLGNIYHHILEQVYRQTSDPTNSNALLATLDAIAPALLDEAPRREGFRATAWWQHTRAEIVENVRASLQALADLTEGFVPFAFEEPFGLRGNRPLRVSGDGGDCFQLRGFIDRVDRDEEGHIRVIDYKTAGPSSYKKSQFAQGKRLQLPLYALAARDALGLGEIADGFYWHVRHAEPSAFRLAGFEGGAENAITYAVAYAWDAIHRARGGHFVPAAPADGCPDYCPAVAFCWHYRPRFGG